MTLVRSRLVTSDRRRVSSLLSVAVALALVLGSVVGGAPAEASLSDGAARWAVSVPGGRFHWSSPAVADVNGDGSNDVVVGGLDGRVHAHSASGAPLPGWPA